MPEHTRMTLSESFGVQHATDECWIRPLILGDTIFTYVAHIPPGGGLPPYPESAQRLQIEHSLYVLNGTLKLTLCGESVTLVPHTAVRIPPGDAVEMKNEGDTTTSIYMAYSPSPWGPDSPLEERRTVTSLAEMRVWYEQQGHRIWSPEEMNKMGGDLKVRQGDLSQLDGLFKDSQAGAGTEEEKLWVGLWDADGYRHEHKPDPPDDFWFRPLVCGEKHLTYIGQVPPNGGVPPSPGEAEHVEMSVYTLAGDLGCIILGEDGEEKTRFILPPHHAVYAPRYVPLGFWNEGSTTASFALTFGPVRPGRESRSEFRDKAVNVAGWTVVAPEILNDMLGDTLWD